MVRAFRGIGLIIVFSTLIAGARADTQVRIATWNVSNYGGGRFSEFQTSIYGEFEGRSMSPDIILGQEFITQFGVDSFVTMLNTAPGSPGDWAAADFINGPDTDNAFFYRTGVVELATDLSPNGVTVVAVGGPAPNHPRNVTRYDVVFNAGTEVEAKLAMYCTHMKSSSGSSDQARRLLEAQRIRDDAELLPADWHFLVGGDFNIQSSSQSAYQEMIGFQANNDGRFFDPIATPGNWNNNFGFRIVHTQDPADMMDDRHDQLLLSANLIDAEGLDYIGEPTIPYSTTTWDDPNHSYRSWGNDGTTYNGILATTGNTMVGPTIAMALIATASGGGHLPVFLDLSVPEVVMWLGDFDGDGDVDLGDFSTFSLCFQGANNAPAPSCPMGVDADFDDDGDVDLGDFAAFSLCFGGANNPPPIGCPQL